ncbi:MAG: ribonuclease HI family protein [candidate division WOR-3 bacterium]
MEIDGAARGNPGPAAIGVLIRGVGMKQIEISRQIGRSTNNQAEYEALIAALTAVRSLRPSEVLVRTDSELLYCQVTGEYRVANPELQALHRRALDLIAELGNVSFERITRQENRAADRLANRAFRKQLAADACTRMPGDKVHPGPGLPADADDEPPSTSSLRT